MIPTAVQRETMIAAVMPRVERGMALLDRERPGWWRTDFATPIDLATLDISSCQLCVLGQSYRGGIYNGFTVGSRKLFGDVLFLILTVDTRIADHAFGGSGGWTGPGDEWTAMKLAWRQAINARRIAAEAETVAQEAEEGGANAERELAYVG